MKLRKLIAAVVVCVWVSANFGTALGCTTLPVPVLAESEKDTMTGLEITFDASKSYDVDPGNYIAKYEFDFDYKSEEGFTVDEEECLEDCGGARDHYFDGVVTHAFDKLLTPAAYDYTVALRVTDNTGRSRTDYAACEVHVHKGVALDGTSDYTSIQDGIEGATSEEEIWVAPGRYGENIEFGAGVEDGIILRSSDPTDPEIVANTVIHAATATSDVVVFGSGITGATKLLGFTIRGAYGWPGNGIYCNGSSPEIKRCVIRGNYSGMYCHNAAQPTVEGCYFYKNIGWGGLSCEGAYTSVDNCVFSENTSVDEYGWNGYGGGIYCGYVSGSGVEVRNCVFSGNVASGQSALGGAIMTFNPGITIVNSIFWGNSPYEIYNGDATFLTIDYCDIQEGFDKCAGVTGGGHNIGDLLGDPTDYDPKFVAESEPAGADRIFGTLDDGLRIWPGSEGSVCIDRASTTAPDTDITGRGRVDVPYVAEVGYGPADIGAYEVPMVWYVWKDGVGNEDGYSWSTAYEELATVLGSEGPSVAAGDEVWVAAGSSYKPGSSRTDSFVLKDGVGLYGGFAGTEVSRSARDWKTNQTVLSGDIDVGGNEDSYHVVKGVDGGVIDGFVISGGRADGSGVDNRGGGMYNEGCEPVVRNCKFKDNYAAYGGGMANYSGSQPVVEGCIFEDNEAGHGGGMYNANCSPVVKNCVFAGNAAVVTAGNGWGGGVCNTGPEGSGWFRNCVFYNNEGVKGGATWNSTWGAVPQYINCTIFSNSASGEGGGIYNRFASPAVTNSIIWNNNDSVSGDSDGDEIYNYYERPVPPPPPSFRCCDIKGELNGSRSGGLDAADGGYNIDASPVFTDEAHPKGTIDGIWMTEDDGLRLVYDASPYSPCIDAADGDAAPEEDIVRLRRCDVGAAGGGYGTPDYVDIGAYEGGPVVVVMCWIDESMDGDVPPTEYPYHSTGTQPDWSVQDGIDKYEAHLASYRAVVKKLPAVRSGCLVPPMTCIYPTCAGDITDVLPPGYDPPDEISVEEFPRYDYGDPPVPLANFTYEFDRIRSGVVPDYVVLIVDTSGSMDRSNIETGYSEKPEDNFIWWLGTNYAGAEIIRVDGTDGKYFGNEEWIGAINIELQNIIDGL